LFLLVLQLDDTGGELGWVHPFQASLNFSHAFIVERALIWNFNRRPIPLGKFVGINSYSKLIY